MSKMKKARSISRPKVDNSRKTLRKQKRQQKKAHRQEHYMKKKTDLEKPVYSAGRFVKRRADEENSHNEVTKKKSKLQNLPSAQDILIRQRAKEVKEADKLKNQMEEQRRELLLQANEDEDRLIKKLEKQLGLNKSKNKNNYFADDGLDYLLEICDKKTTEQIVAAEKHLAEVEGDSDFEQDLAVVTGKELPKKKLKDKKKPKKDDMNDEKHNNDLDDDDDTGSENEDVSDDESADFDDETGDFGDETGDFDDETGIVDSDGDSDDDADELSDGGDETDSSDAPEEKPAATKKSKDKQEKENKSKELKLKQDTKSKAEKETKKIKDIKPTKSKERIVKAEDLSKIFSDDEVSNLSGDDDDLEGFSGDQENDVVEEKKHEKPDVWEDIYGRKRDKEGNIIKEEKGVYVPPHLRNKDSADDKQMLLLKRQIKSVLNKLAGTNLHWACTSIENLYSNNSRNSVNTALTQLWLEATVGPSHTPDRLVTEHAALISVLHANVGSEIGAHFLQELCKRFDDMMQTEQPMEDKRLDNLVACLALLYSFKIYQATLLYDVLRRLLSSVTEKRIDCVVVCLRCVGGALRRDAPAALRAFLARTQAQLAALPHAHTGSRVSFLLEVLMAIKNNNLTKIPNYDPSYQEELKKLSRSIVRKGNYVTTLNITLEDLLKADERGKWWVVGSAWEGNSVSSKQEEVAVKAVPSRDQKLLELARKQRMNTDVRRSIFCVIMSAEDYMDAFEKLQHLGLKGQQEREIVHVLLACCLQEKTFNPYYAVLGQKLCDFDRKYQLSIQYSIWDRIKDIENQPKLTLNNLAQFLVHLIMQKGLPLSVLKVIQFSELNKHSVRFMRQILLAIIMNEDLQTSLEVFHRISKSPKLHLFRESLKLFIQHFLVKNAGKSSAVLSASEMEVLRDRAGEVTKILTMHDSKLRL